MHSINQTAVLLMAYGSPNSLEEIEPYYADIRGGRRPSAENLAEVTERYKRIGGRSPLLDITREQARALQNRLAEDYHVYFGMKHWHPYIRQAVRELVRAGHSRCIAIALAPHYSKASIDGYVQRVQAAAQEHETHIEFEFVKSWNDHPLFLQSVANRLELARQLFSSKQWSDITVLFSAHSLPERILQDGDPYPIELRETCEGVADLLSLPKWIFAYQSAGRTGERWLGPDILQVLENLAVQGTKQVLIAPIGFVSDHLEILYDIDVECAERARGLGLAMYRIGSPNADPMFISVLERLVRENDPWNKKAGQ